MSLAQLAAFAVANNNTSATRTPIYDLSIEDARARVKIGDGNKQPREDGQQALTLSLGKHKLPLDVIAEKATRINAPAEQVEAFTVALQDAVNAGDFDVAIQEAQAKADPANKPVAPEVEAVGTVSAEAPVQSAQVDLDSLD